MKYPVKSTGQLGFQRYDIEDHLSLDQLMAVCVCGSLFAIVLCVIFNIEPWIMVVLSVTQII